MNDEFYFEDDDGNEFVFEDEDDVAPKGSSSISSQSTEGDSSEEEWIFEEDSDEDTDTSSRSLSRAASEPIVKSRSNTSPGEASPRLFKKFSTKIRPGDLSPSPKIEEKRLASSTTEIKPSQRHSQSRVQMVNPSRASAINRSLDSSKKTNRVANDLPQIKPVRSKPVDEQADLADQIAALRIIASKGKDTKYLSIRGASHPVAPPPVVEAVTSIPTSDARTNIVNEIVTTEETYVNDLEVLIRLYLEPLSTRRNKKKKPIITKEQVRGLFSNIESILNLNRVLLADLKKQTLLPPQDQRIGAAFNLLAKCLLIYTDYCSNQKNADDLYTKLKSSNDQFNALCAENQAKPECRMLDLNAFLIKPVQRACKYPLLLRELLKETPESHPDYADLKEAFEAMQESCLKLNERKRDVENMSHFLTIKARTGKNFIEQGRSFVDDGHISIITEKVNRRSGKVKYRLRKGRYVLFSDMVVFISEGKVIAQVSLSTCQIQEPNLPAHPLALLLLARASKLILLPGSQAEKDTISKLITEQIEQLQSRNKSRNLHKATPPSRLASRNRLGDNTVTYECVYNGNTKPIKMPVTCQSLRPFSTRLQRGFQLQESSITINFVMGEGKTMEITNDQELSQYLPFLQQVILLPK